MILQLGVLFLKLCIKGHGQLNTRKERVSPLSFSLLLRVTPDSPMFLVAPINLDLQPAQYPANQIHGLGY